MPVEYVFRKPTGSPADRGAAPPRYRREDGPAGMIIERDVPVPVRGGVTVYADVFRPADERPAPPLIAWSPYGKHAGPQLPERYPDGGVAPGQVSRYTAFELPDPVFWTARGYAVVNADMPGTWYSGGNATFLSPEEAVRGHDLIEWAGTQSWSSGRVGMSGVSYLTSSQWTIAATRPPHLAAINPWEGWSDTYREVARHGGIPETDFWPYIGERWGFGTGQIEDLAAETAAHPFFDDFWASKAAPLSRITVPAYVVASWSDQGLHTRGTFEGFTSIGSARKWLDAHGGKKWGYGHRRARAPDQPAGVPDHPHHRRRKHRRVRRSPRHRAARLLLRRVAPHVTSLTRELSRGGCQDRSGKNLFTDGQLASSPSHAPGGERKNAGQGPVEGVIGQVIRNPVQHCAWQFSTSQPISSFLGNLV